MRLAAAGAAVQNLQICAIAWPEPAFVPIRDLSFEKVHSRSRDLTFVRLCYFEVLVRSKIIHNTDPLVGWITNNRIMNYWCDIWNTLLTWYLRTNDEIVRKCLNVWTIAEYEKRKWTFTFRKQFLQSHLVCGTACVEVHASLENKRQHNVTIIKLMRSPRCDTKGRRTYVLREVVTWFFKRMY